MAWVQATKTAKSPSPGMSPWKLIRWAVLAVLLLIVVQMLRHPSPPTASAPTKEQAMASAASFRNKLDGLAAAHDQVAGQEARFSEEEVNAYIQQSIGALPLPDAAGSPSSTPTGNEDSAGAAVKNTTVGMTGDEITVQITLERFGRDIYFTLSGKLGAENGYATFHPTSCKLGDLNIPLGFVDQQVQQKLNEPENRERMKLPDFIQDIRVENGQLVIVEK